ncbi:hypothetical protein Tsubulata_043421 [Turnera subulata]|uniref:Kelch repeat-containing protein n=1 Tax=Turnera subulata TaxID=218843 RepID=A0A9Q0F0V4_9ROSI|nr:hypothetical protein Tsubulata_043421 [Turnera subulata]
MAKSLGHKGKHHKTVCVLSGAILGAFLIADVFWTSSSSVSSAYQSIASRWDLAKSRNFVVVREETTQYEKTEAPTNEEGNVASKNLSATFADLPAPETEWEQMATAPVPRLDGYSIQIKNMLYVFVGYENLDHVHSHVDVYNFSDNTWGESFRVPRGMGNSHLGIATDGRYIYIVSGQLGPQCRASIANTFSLDTKTRKWQRLPPLPRPRYAPATQLWRGRLHVMGGGKEDRHTPALDHWSIAVKDGKALEKKWQTEVPIPRGGPHRACIAVNDRLFVIGGQEGDFQPKPGSPIFKCSRRSEVLYGDVYMLDAQNRWTVLPPMPKPDSHIECAWVIVNNSIIITGGTTEKHPVSNRMTLVGEVFQFHLDSLTWSVIGRLPYRIKTTLTGYWDGWLYFTSGQRDRGPDNPQPRKVVGETWRTKLHLQS